MHHASEGMMALRLAVAWIGSVVLLAAGETCAVQGPVSDMAGRPVPYAAVSAIRATFPLVPPAAGATADPNGRYCLRGLAAGDYFVRAEGRTLAMSASPSCVDCCAPTRGVTPTSHRVRVRVTRSETDSLFVNIRMRERALHCVKGEVRDTSGRLRPDLTISLASDTQSVTVIQEGGRFLLTKVPSGRYTMRVSDEAAMDRVIVTQAIVVPSDGIVRVVVRY